MGGRGHRSRGRPGLGRARGLGRHPDLGHADLLLAAGRPGPRRSGPERARPLLPARLAGQDTAGLLAVAADIPPVRITRADFTYSADARAGQATATFTPSPVDDTAYGVTITYANGVTENASIMNMIAMGGPSGWRMNIGTEMGAGPAGPPTAGP